jgi:hypothetical protein
LDSLHYTTRVNDSVCSYSGGESPFLWLYIVFIYMQKLNMNNSNIVANLHKQYNITSSGTVSELIQSTFTRVPKGCFYKRGASFTGRTIKTICLDISLLRLFFPAALDNSE